jgi:hypothetical protein
MRIHPPIPLAPRGAVRFSVLVGLWALLVVAQPQAQSLADLAREQQAKRAAQPTAKAEHVYTNDNLPRTGVLSTGSEVVVETAAPPQQPVEWKSDVNAFNASMEEFRSLNGEQLGQVFISKANPELVREEFAERRQWEQSLFAAKQKFVDSANEYANLWQSCQASVTAVEMAGAGQRQTCLTNLAKTRAQANQAKTELYKLAEKGQQAVKTSASSVPGSKRTATVSTKPATVSAKPATTTPKTVPKTPTASKPVARLPQ